MSGAGNPMLASSELRKSTAARYDVDVPTHQRPDAPTSTRARPISIADLRDAVEELGARLTGCERRCPGIVCDVAAGSMPRCLIFESRGCERLDGGVIVVGMNPGKADDAERRVIKELFGPQHDPRRAYASYLTWLDNAIQRIPFYTLMRAALAAMGHAGPILWTEIVKCESGKPIAVEGKTKPVPFGLADPFRTTTVRTCRDEHLRGELALCPQEWPIVAAGLGVGKYLDDTRAELAGTRQIVAVPHPTGSEDFLRVFVPATLAPSAEVVERVRQAGPSSFTRLSAGAARIEEISHAVANVKGGTRSTADGPGK